MKRPGRIATEPTSLRPTSRRPLRPSTIRSDPAPFDPAAELDWGDPVMNRRLLREHLDQDHDGASRRIPVVEGHVHRLRHLLPPSPARLLDAACGPGLYAVRLARLGYEVVAVDVGDAVLRHARGLARDAGVGDRVSLHRSDLRTLRLDAPVDAALLVYYVLEGFPRREQVTVLRRLHDAVRPGGRVIAELRVRPEQPPGRVTAWDVVPRSLLADRRHLLLTDTVYDDTRDLYILRELAVFDDGSVAVQQTTGRLLRLDEVAPLFARAGLRVTAVYDGFSRHRATGLSESLLVVAERPGPVSPPARRTAARSPSSRPPAARGSAPAGRRGPG